MAASLALVGGIGCNSTCGDLCAHYASCDAEFLFGDIGCDWEDDEDAVEDACLESCEDEYDRLSDGDAEEVDICVECVMDDIGDSCKAGKMEGSVEDDCNSECDDRDVGDFFEDFFDDWEPQNDVDCPMYDEATG
jgi:hypothetical protein